MTTITVTRKEEVKIEYVQVHAGVRYWCDATVQGVQATKAKDKDRPRVEIELHEPILP